MDSFYTSEEIKNMGFKKVGSNVKISKKASLYGTEMMEMGSSVRIDDFCILSGKIVVGNYVHIGAYSGLYGGTAGVHIEDFAGLSSKVSIYAVSDDYSGESMTNPMVGDIYKNMFQEKVIISKHTIVGATSVILPGVVTGEGSAFGAMSLVTKSTEPWSIYAGAPCKKIKERKRNLLNMEKLFNNDKAKKGE